MISQHWPERTVDIGAGAGTRFADDGKRRREPARCLRKSHCKSVTNGFVEPGRIGVRKNIFAKNPMHGIEQRDCLDRHPIRAVLRPGGGHDDFQPTFNRKHSRIVLPAR